MYVYACMSVYVYMYTVVARASMGSAVIGGILENLLQAPLHDATYLQDKGFRISGPNIEAQKTTNMILR